MTSNTPPVRMGVLGCASIAERRMLPAMLDHPQVQLTAVASRSAAKAQRFADRFGAEPVTGYARLLERADVDAVYVPLPPHLHYEWTVAALRAGKHVLCEKPFVPTVGEADRAVQVAHAAGLVLMESFMFLHHGQHATVRELVESGVIGELRGFWSEFGIPADRTGAAPRHLSTLPEVAAYPIRAARLFLGDGLRVLGATETPTAGGALLARPAGPLAQLAYGVDHGYRSGYALWGSAGRIVLDRAFSTPDTHSPVVRIERQDHVEKRILRPDKQFTNLAGAFVRAVRDGAGTAEAADDILRHARLVESIRAAAGRP